MKKLIILIGENAIVIKMESVEVGLGKCILSTSGVHENLGHKELEKWILIKSILK
jgi:hypothetical protein